MSSRRELNSSEESNPSSGTQGSDFSRGSAVSGGVHGSNPYESYSPAQPPHPPLWTPFDRPGRDGIRDRLKRQWRLERSIELSPEQLREVLLFMYDNEGLEGVKWTPEVLYAYVPRTFEAGAVSEGVAQTALKHAIPRNFARHIPA